MIELPIAEMALWTWMWSLLWIGAGLFAPNWLRALRARWRR